MRRHLPEPLRPVVTFAYMTGWRIPSDVLTREWRQVDFATSTVCLDLGSTKNAEGRVFYFTPARRTCLEAQRSATEATQRKTARVVPYMFYRDGRPIRDFRTAWANACQRASVPGRSP